MDPATNAAQARYCLYARKSSEQDERQALSIDAQVKEMLEIAEREKLEVVATRRESHSAKDSGQRPEFTRMISDIRDGTFDAILTWAPDRLSRNGGDLGVLVDLMDQKKLVGIRTHGQMFTNSPNEKFLLMILCSQAKLENDNKGINVKRGLRARVEMGLWPGVAPTGYLNENRTDRKGSVIVDKERGPVIRAMYEKVAELGWSGRQVYKWLIDDLRFTTKSGKPLFLSNIYLILQNTFYYGRFEYPRKSSNWYDGKHEPLITKDLFERVQRQLNRDNIERTESKEFAFTKLMICGQCGSGVTAQEKHKKLRGGSVARYVYYNCTHSKDIDCKAGAIREEDLIEQLLGIIDEVSLDKLGMKAAMEKEYERYHKFRMGVLGLKVDETRPEIDSKNYIKYLLRNGTVFEKRELLSHLRSKLVYNNKSVTLLS